MQYYVFADAKEPMCVAFDKETCFILIPDSDKQQKNANTYSLFLNPMSHKTVLELFISEDDKKNFQHIKELCTVPAIQAISGTLKDLKKFGIPSKYLVNAANHLNEAANNYNTISFEEYWNTLDDDVFHQMIINNKEFLEQMKEQRNIEM